MCNWIGDNGNFWAVFLLEIVFLAQLAGFWMVLTVNFGTLMKVLSAKERQ